MRARFVFFVATAAAAMLAACGGGSVGNTYMPSSSIPQAETTSVPLSTSGTTAVTFATPNTSGATATITLPSVNVSTTASLSYTGSAPAGVSTPEMSTIKKSDAIGGGNLSVFAYIALTVSSPVVITTTPAFSFTTALAQTGTAYVAYYDAGNPSAGWNVLLGPGTISGTNITFAAQSLNPPITFAAGDTYIFALVVSTTPATAPSLSYGGAKNVNFSYGYAFGYPTPGPTATAPPANLAYSVSTTVSAGSSPYPGTTTASLIDEHVAESDVQSLETTTYTTDSWLGLDASSSPYTELLYGSTQQEPSSENLPDITTLYTNAQQVDEYPAGNGATWTNNPASTVTYSYADGDNGTRAVASDGSYVDTENLLSGGIGGQAVLTENSDGSGLITGPYFGGDIISSVAFAAPSPAASPTAIDVTVNYTTDAQNDYGYPPSETIAAPVWYSLPISLYSETDTVTTGASLPKSCAPFTTATDVNRTITTLDTVIGYTETTVFDSYEFNGVPICLTTTDTQNYAYDQQQNTPYFLYITPNGSPLETVTTTESLVLGAASSGSTASSAMRSAAMPATVTAGVPARNGIVASLEAHQLSYFARERVIRTRTLLQAVRSQKAASSIRSIQGGVR